MRGRIFLFLMRRGTLQESNRQLQAMEIFTLRAMKIFTLRAMEIIQFESLGVAFFQELQLASSFHIGTSSLSASILNRLLNQLPNPTIASNGSALKNAKKNKYTLQMRKRQRQAKRN